MTDHTAILAPQFVSGVAYTAVPLDSDAPHADHATRGTWLEQATARFGEPSVAIDKPRDLGDRIRRCWVWFVDGQNYNLAIDDERPHRGRFHTTAGGPGRHAELWTDAEPTDAEIRIALDQAWPGFAARATADRAAADKAAQAEALRLVLREIPAAFGSEAWAQMQAVEIVTLVAHELGVEL